MYEYNIKYFAIMGLRIKTTTTGLFVSFVFFRSQSGLEKLHQPQQLTFNSPYRCRACLVGQGGNRVLLTKCDLESVHKRTWLSPVQCF